MYCEERTQIYCEATAERGGGNLNAKSPYTEKGVFKISLSDEGDA